MPFVALPPPPSALGMGAAHCFVTVVPLPVAVPILTTDWVVPVAPAGPAGPVGRVAPAGPASPVSPLPPLPPATPQRAAGLTV